MIEKISEKLEIIKKAVLDTVKAKYIYLFGSYAYGTPDENSDIDIYVVIPDMFDDKYTETMEKIISFLFKQNILKIDLFLVEENVFLECKKYSSFEKNVCEKGILLYEY